LTTRMISVCDFDLEAKLIGRPTVCEVKLFSM